VIIAFFSPVFKPIHITVFYELIVFVVGNVNVVGIFEGAPKIFSAGGNLSGVGDDAIAITAIQTIEFLRHVQIRQFMTVGDHIRTPRDQFKAINAKADVLIDGEKHIQKQQRHDHGIDQRCGKIHQWPRLNEKLHKLRLAQETISEDGFVENSSLVLSQRAESFLLRHDVFSHSCSRLNKGACRCEIFAYRSSDTGTSLKVVGARQIKLYHEYVCGVHNSSPSPPMPQRKRSLPPCAKALLL